MKNIVATETSLNSENEMCFCISGYNFVCENRVSKIGGGAGLYIAEYIGEYRAAYIAEGFDYDYVRRGWFIGIDWYLGPSTWDKIHAWAFGFDHVITLSKLRTYTCAQAKQAIHHLGVGKLVPAISRE